MAHVMRWNLTCIIAGYKLYIRLSKGKGSSLKSSSCSKTTKIIMMMMAVVVKQE